MEKTLLDKQEIQEWIDALDDIDRQHGAEGVGLIYGIIKQKVEGGEVDFNKTFGSNVNNIIGIDAMPTEDKRGVEAEKVILWNAFALVVQAEKKYPGLGGHIATYASASVLYRIGFDYFFRGDDWVDGGDLIYFQGHASPEIYARSFLEGRLSVESMAHFRQEVEGKGARNNP